MANYMYLNLSGVALTVYGSSDPFTSIGTINNNDSYVINNELPQSYNVYFSKNGLMQFGEIRKPISDSARVSIVTKPYAREVINGESCLVYRVRRDAELFDSSANYTGYVKAGMFVACKDGLAGTSYPYLKHVSYVMSSKGNVWQGNTGFVDTGIRDGAGPFSINMYGNWGGNSVEPLPESFETINKMVLNASSAITVEDANGKVLGQIPSSHAYALKEKIGTSKYRVQFSLNGAKREGFTRNLTDLQKINVLERAFRTEVIEGKTYYIFQIRKQRRVYDSFGGSWGRVGTYMLVACKDALIGNGNSHYKSIQYLQRSSDLAWVKVTTDTSDYGFVDTGLFEEGGEPDKVCLYGNWGGNTLKDPRDELPYTVEHIPVDSTGKRTLIPMEPEFLTIHSTANPDSDAWGERNYLTNPDNTANTAYHLVVDYKEVIEVMPLNEVAYHCGNLEGNKISAGLEICEIGNREKTLQNAIKVAADFLNERRWSVQKLRRHTDWANKNCPRIFTTHQASPTHTWEWFVGEVGKSVKPIEPMYTDEAERTMDRYRYNVHCILNEKPVAIQEGMTLEQKKALIGSNLQNLLGAMASQFSTRQKGILEDIAETLKTYTSQELDGIHEFRYEGGGSYRSGTTTNNTYNSAVMSVVSMDFTQLKGSHFDNQVPEEWADGFGLYGAMAVVYKKGDFRGIFFRSSTLPNRMEAHDTVADGTFKFIVGTHPAAGGYKALNLYTLDGNRTLPAAIEKVGEVGVSGVNGHMGYNSERGSEGCFTIPGLSKDETNANYDYGKYIALFNKGEEGKYVVKRLVDLPRV